MVKAPEKDMVRGLGKELEINVSVVVKKGLDVDVNVVIERVRDGKDLGEEVPGGEVREKGTIK